MRNLVVVVVALICLLVHSGSYANTDSTGATTRSGFITNMQSGKCIDVSGTPFSGAPLQLWDCEDSAGAAGTNTDQKWSLTADGFIKNNVYGKCIDVSGAPGTATGSPLLLWDCELSGFNADNGSPTDQKWTITADGFIRNALSGKCIDVSGAPGTTNGSRLLLWDCEYSAMAQTDHRWNWSSGAFAIDTTTVPSADLNGPWWNANESGWGISIMHRYDTIAGAMFTFDAGTNPVWYSTVCQIIGDRCTGALYRTTGGRAATTAWNGASVSTKEVGSIAFVFTGYDTGTVAFSIDGVSGSKSITKLPFGTPPSTGGSIVGTWVASNAPISTYGTITFYKDGTFLIFENDAPPNGAEAGTYVYDNSSEQLTLNFTYDDNGPTSSGFGNGVGSTRTTKFVVNGNTATVTTPSGNLTLNRQ